MTKRYLRQRIKEAERALRNIGIAANTEESYTAEIAKKEVRRYAFNHTKFTITKDGKLIGQFTEV